MRMLNDVRQRETNGARIRERESEEMGENTYMMLLLGFFLLLTTFFFLR